MRYLCALIASSSVMLTANIGLAAGTRNTFAARYEGGTLQLVQGKIRATVAAEALALIQGGRRLTIRPGQITALFCGRDARYETAAFFLGRVPWKHVETVESYYVGVAWTGAVREGGRAIPAEAVFRLSSGDYRDFVVALERLTGMRATDTAKIPTTVRIVKEPGTPHIAAKRS
jgi:hypothetical protein